MIIIISQQRLLTDSDHVGPGLRPGQAVLSTTALIGQRRACGPLGLLTGSETRSHTD